MSTEKVFAKGFIFKRNEKAPEFVVGSLSLKSNEAIEFIKEQGKEWVNLDVKKSKEGKYYVELNTYEKIASNVSQEDDSLPF